MNETEGGKISGGQLEALLVLTRIVVITIAFPAATGLRPPQDIWIVTTVGTALSVPLIFLVAHLGLKFPDKTIVEQAQLLLGKWPGKIAGILLVWYWIGVAAEVARGLGDAYTAAIMPETPILVFIMGTVFLAANAARNGLETIGRLGEGVIWIVLFFAALVLVLPYDEMKLKNLVPILSQGFRPLMGPIGIVVSFYLQFIILGMVVPYMTRPEDVVRHSMRAIVSSGLIMTWFGVALVAVFGPTVPDMALPAFGLSRMVSIANFFERIEAVVLGAWTLSCTIKLALFLWASAVGLAQVFGIPRYQSLVYPLGAMTVVLAVLFFESSLDLQRFLRFENFGVHCLSITMGITLLLHLAAFFRHQTSRRSGARG